MIDKQPKVAAIQVNHCGKIDAALDRAYKVIEANINGELKGVDLIGFPDHWLHTAHPHKNVEKIPGPTTDAVGDLARKYNAYVVISLYEQGEPGRFVWLNHPMPYKVYNTNVLIGPDGRVVGTHRRTNFTICEALGNDYNVFDTEIGRVAMTSCGEMCYPEVMRIYALQDADFLIWTSTHIDFRGIEHMPADKMPCKAPPLDLPLLYWKVQVRNSMRKWQAWKPPVFSSVVAWQNDFVVICANSSGEEALAGTAYKMQYLGGSRISYPFGILAKAGAEECAIAAVIPDLEEMRQMRELFRASRRPETYGLVSALENLRAEKPCASDSFASTWSSLSGERQCYFPPLEEGSNQE
ncbi:MAG: carbon-nitrogen hydrolase family protein [bacterium]